MLETTNLIDLNHQKGIVGFWVGGEFRGCLGKVVSKMCYQRKRAITPWLSLSFPFAMHLIIALPHATIVKSKQNHHGFCTRVSNPLNPPISCVWPWCYCKTHVFFFFFFFFLHLHLSHSKPKSLGPKLHSCVISFLNPPRVLTIVLFLYCVIKLFWGLDLRSQHLEDKVFLMGQRMLWKEESNNNGYNKQLTLIQRCNKQTQGRQAQIRGPKGESSNLNIWKISYNQFWPGMLS